ncbi:MAG TPA: hypothetical protein VGG05_09050 [Pseudonocardiaceae bacterium]
MTESWPSRSLSSVTEGSQGWVLTQSWRAGTRPLRLGAVGAVSPGRVDCCVWLDCGATGLGPLLGHRVRVLVDYQNQDLSFVDGVDDVVIGCVDTERVRVTGEGDRIVGLWVIGQGVDGVLQLAAGGGGEGEESGAGFGADEDAVAHR